MSKQEIKKYSTEWYEEFSPEDTRYYGVFEHNKYSAKESISVDMKRFCSYFGIDNEIKNLTSNKNSRLYNPSKVSRLDYRINYVKEEISLIQSDWNKQKAYISKVLSEIKGKEYSLADDDEFQNGIVTSEEAGENAIFNTKLSEILAEKEKDRFRKSLYAQYFHQLAAQVDAIILRLLTNNGWEGDTYNRNVLLAFKGNKEESIKNLKSYKYYNKMYVIWNFLKHNSISTYKKVKQNCNDILIRNDYKQGNLSCYFMDISESLIDKIINGVLLFLVEYCGIVFEEDKNLAGWDYENFFRNAAQRQIFSITNSNGYPFEFYE